MASHAIKFTIFALFLIFELTSGCALCKGKGKGSSEGCCPKPCQTIYIRENCCCKPPPPPCTETLIVQEDCCAPCCTSACNPYGLGCSYYSYPIGGCVQCNRPTARLILRQPECCRAVCNSCNSCPVCCSASAYPSHSGH